MATLLERIQGNNTPVATGGTLLDRIKQAEQNGVITSTSSTQKQAEVPEEKKKGLFPLISKAIATAGAVGEGITELMNAMPAGLSQAELKQIQETLTRERKTGLGVARPAGIDEQGQEKKLGGQIADVLGTGLGVGSVITPGAVGTQLLSKGAGIGAKMLGSGLASATGSALPAFGQGLVEQKPFSEIAGDTAKQALLGFGAGAAIPAVGSLALKSPAFLKAVGQLASKAPSTISGAARQVPEAASTALGAGKRFAQAVPEYMSSLKENIAEGAKTAAERAAYDKPIRQAISAGIPENKIRQLQDLGEENIKVIRKVVDIAEKEAFKSGSGGSIKSPAAEVIVGELKKVRNAAKSVGKQIGDVERTGKIDPIAGSELRQNAITSLQDSGVNFTTTRTGDVVAVPGGQFVGDEAKVFNRLLGEIDLKGSLTAQDVINIKRRINKQAGNLVRKMNLKDADIQRVTGALMDAIDEALPDAYKSLAKEYSILMKTLQGWLDVIGPARNQFYSVDDLLEKGGAFFSEKGMRSLGNASAKIEGLLENLSNISAQYGYKGATDLPAINEWIDIIENAYGLTKRGSLQGRATQAGKDVAEAAMTAGSAGVPGLVTKGLSVAIGQTKKNQQTALKDLIRFMGEKMPK